MTVTVPGQEAPTSEVVPYNGDISGLGLEDVTTSDLSIPRMNIIGKRAVFQNTQTKEEFPELETVLISMVKQRVMFHKDLDMNYKRPQCRSTDHEVGFPNVDPKAPVERQFPWADGNFEPTAGQQGLYLPQVIEETGLPGLPCDKCKFKDWEGGKTRCKEQHVYPLFYRDSEGVWMPAVLTIQGSGIKPSKTYVAGFKTSNQPLFTVITHLSLTPASKGSVDYAVPVFRKVGGSDPANYEDYTANVHEMRGYLRRWPTKRDDDDEAVTDSDGNSNSGPSGYVPLPGAVAAAPAIQQAEVVPPAAAPAATPEPAAKPAAAPSLTPPAPSLPAPTPPVAPVATPAPAAAPAAPAGYEAVWDTMPDAAKQAILAATAAPTGASSAAVAPAVQPAVPAQSSGDLPF